MTSLFTPIQIGGMTLSHRVVMAPLTRRRAGEGNVPTSLMAEYYRQRASPGGLLITEGTPISPRAYAHFDVPGIVTDLHIEGWRVVTSAVHGVGGYIFLQLWHVGRQSHPLLQPGGTQPIAPSAIQAEGVAHTPGGPVAFGVPRALALDEIPGVIDEYRQASRRAMEAGFDGVELHAANGYLPDQFLQDGSNTRTDRYGGTLENRARFLTEAIAACVEACGEGKVGVRISPSGTFGSMSDTDPEATFSYLAERLNEARLAYLHIIEPRIHGADTIDDRPPVAAARLRHYFHGVLIAAGGFTGAAAADLVAQGGADMVAFGRHFIANPDLPERLRLGLPLNAYDRSTFAVGGERGYTDYPSFRTGS